ncbi:hypothetical protein N7450_008571 [Penicillium hetheringtonii]|uniref:Cupin 2 conserved barrel domain-containing protein n=1 Tax=Penicillium hetheringtonii TaxID=911720 RepID=A0AAD6DDC8_9EURO|nr:hypothetical protein N7450_008571 [Penicillium hetheringtonii]
MPGTIIIPSSAQGSQPTLNPTATFTGDVYLDIYHMNDTTAMTNVTFTPCSRWICDKGAEPRRIKIGDMIWAPPGTTHWHGADEDSPMTHFVIALGKTTWHEAVTDEQYGVKE